MGVCIRMCVCGGTVVPDGVCVCVFVSVSRGGCVGVCMRMCVWGYCGAGWCVCERARVQLDIGDRGGGRGGGEKECKSETKLTFLIKVRQKKEKKGTVSDTYFYPTFLTP